MGPGRGLVRPCSARGCHRMALGKRARSTLWVSSPHHIPPRDQSESPRQQKCGGGVPSGSLTSIILTGLSLLPYSPFWVGVWLFSILLSDLFSPIAPLCLFSTLFSEKSFLLSTLCRSSSHIPESKSLPSPRQGTFWGTDSYAQI